MENYRNKHYIITDDQGRITSGWSDGPHPDRDTTGAICVNEQGGYQFRLPVMDDLATPGVVLGQMTEENPPLYAMDGIPLYKWDGLHVLKRSKEEIAADRAAIPEPPPSQNERMEAQIVYTAMMTNTLLEA